MKHKLILSILTLTLILSFPLVSGTFSYSFTYLEFNSGATVWKSSDETRTSWKIEIQNSLTYNTSETLPVAKILFGNSTNATTCLPMHFNTWYADSGSTWSFEVRLATKVNPSADDYALLKKVEKLPYGEDGKVFLRLDTNGDFNVGNETDEDVYLDEYAMGSFDISYIGRVGSFSENGSCATAGYISVILSDYSVSMTSTLNDLVVPILNLTMLGIAITFVRKFK